VGDTNRKAIGITVNSKSYPDQQTKPGRSKMANILIVDDQPYLKEILTDELSHREHHIESIENPDAVITSLEEHKPDIVLLDLYLRGFEGWDILRDIKQKDPQLPVIIVSAYDNFMDDPRVGIADGYVVKDARMDKLKETISES
jgi:DNA-binding NtrC family response regulator